MGLAFSMDSVCMCDSCGQHVSEGYPFHTQLILESASAKLRGDVKQCVLSTILPVWKYC